jgi:hypothetical protein
LRNSKAFAVDFFENNIAAPAQKCFAYFFTQQHCIVTIARFAENSRPIRMRDEAVQTNARSRHFGESANRNLASATEFIQQRAFASDSGSSSGIVKKCQ